MSKIDIDKAPGFANRSRTSESYKAKGCKVCWG